MPRIFRQELTVTEEAIDEFGHVNNQRYIACMQEVATAHSTASGWPMERYLAIGAAWVVCSHFIEYLRPAFAVDRIEIFTWAAGLALREVVRKWVYVDLKSGRPRRVPEEPLGAFEAVPGTMRN